MVIGRKDLLKALYEPCKRYMLRELNKRRDERVTEKPSLSLFLDACYGDGLKFVVAFFFC